MGHSHNVTFDEFFTSGMEESVSPYLTENSRSWAKNLSLRAAILSAICLVLAYVSSFHSEAAKNAFLVLVYFLSGTPALRSTIEDLKEFTINIDILMTLAAFLSVFIGAQLEGGLLIVLFNLSGAMEDAVSSKAMGALHNLHKIAPTKATVIDADGNHLEQSIKGIEVDTKILVKAGEVVPLDGKVIDGQSLVNLVHLTGESVPVSTTKGDTVQAGARNLDGTLTLHVTKTSAESTLSQIINLIKHAQETKPKLQRFLDTFSRTYATTIISLFFLFAITLPFLLNITYFGIEGSVYRALTFLIAASPCALIIATPTAYLSSISACARNGILMKGGVILDALATCKAFVFDKTGTLTTGQLTLDTISHSAGDAPLSEDKVLQAAAALEAHVTHPIGVAICEKAKAQGLQIFESNEFKNVPGYGIEGKVSVDGTSYEAFVGNSAYITEKTSLQLKDTSNTSAYMLLNNNVYAFEFVDTLREGIQNTVQSLVKDHSVRTVMLTGDHQKAAMRVAQETGITDVFADLRPDDKLKKVEEIDQATPCAMIGDGINDAPSLARATVGISLGQVGSATAIDASDIVLLNDKMDLLPWLFGKSQKTSRVIIQNLTLALAVICLTPLPALFGYVPLWIAVILHEGGTLLVGLNSLRLLKK